MDGGEGEINREPSPLPPPRGRLYNAFPTVVRYSGLGIAFWETFAEHVDRPALLGLAGSMMLGSLAADAYQSRNK